VQPGDHRQPAGLAKETVMDEAREMGQVAEEVWRIYLTTGQPPSYLKVPWYMGPGFRSALRRLPSDPRCRLCAAPFGGAGGKVIRLALGLAPSRLNPQICDVCDRFIQEYRGGAEVDTSILFADVRGSTRLAEGMRPADFSQLINRFYVTVSDVLHQYNGLVEKLIGDEVTGFFVSGMAGPDHTRVALEAAREILAATGHGDPSGPWLPVGVGVHTGTAFVGSVGKPGGGADITVLGDVPNTGSRLASLAAAGEVLLSEAARVAAGWDTAGLEPRQLELKGRSDSLAAWAFTPSLAAFR
jgi:adenylate cyclase